MYFKVQSRGRARADAGKLYLITESGSLNLRREKENRMREKEMNQALEQYHSQDSEALFDKLSREFATTTGHLPLSSSVHSFFTTSPSTSSLSSLSSTRSLDDPKLYHVHCRHCSTALFPASDLKFREPSYYSVNPKFQTSLVRQLDHRQPNIHCSKSDCGKELGQKIYLKNGSFLYMINIKGVKFAKMGRDGFDSPSKWSKIEFQVNNL